MNHRIALLQMTSGIDPRANLAVMETAIADAAASGAEMLFLPEMCGLLDSNRDRARGHLAGESENPVLAGLQAAARKHGIWIHVGSLAIRDAGGDGRLANRGFVITATGEIAARYDKMHLFDVDLPTGESWRESNAYAPGESAVISATPVGMLGLSVCYDLRFPALYAALSGGGAGVIAIPAAFTVPTGEAHWHVLMRARAIENACYVVAAAQHGRHEDGRATFGHSLVVDPWGAVILECAAPGLAFAEIDPAKIADARTRIPVLAHRRAIPPVSVSS